MVSIEGLRRTGEYIKNVTGRSIGADLLQQCRQTKVFTAIDRPDRVADELDLAQMIFRRILFPATPEILVKEYGPKDDKDDKIRSKAIKGIKFLAALGIDLSSFLASPAVAIVLNNPSYLLGLLGKPLYNVVVQATSKLVDARAFRKKDLPKANSGTYGILERLYDEFYDPEFEAGLVRTSEGNIIAIVRKEEVCARTGGSCMDLILPKTEGGKRWLEVAHVTEKNVVADIVSEKSRETPPKIAELMADVAKSLNQTESPALL